MNTTKRAAIRIATVFFEPHVILLLAVVVLGWLSMQLDAKSWTAFELTEDVDYARGLLPGDTPRELRNVLTLIARRTRAVAVLLNQVALILPGLVVVLTIGAARTPRIPKFVRFGIVAYAIYCVLSPFLILR
jgi:hypothetical protein